MRRLCAIFSILSALALAGVASGVVGGQPDTTHTWVGAAIQHQVHDGASGNERCSGFMVSPTAFVTAAHCFPAQFTDPIRITFAPDSLDPGAAFIEVPASAVANSPDLDIAVITVPAQPAYATPGAPTGSSVDVVGYGVQTISHKTPTSFGQRMIASTKLASAGNLEGLYLKLLADPGACLGDSGGPDLNAQGQPVAINSYSNGNSNCNGVTYSLRLDNPGVQAFIAAHS